MNIWWLHEADFGGWMALLGALCIGHAFADYSLQTDFMAKAKNRNYLGTIGDLPPDMPASTLWLFVLSAHAAIHSGVVWILTGCGWLGLAEFIFHWVVDWMRGEGKISFRTDQIAHLGCKAVYVTVLALS